MNIIFVLEIIGTVAFAFSGAMVAINKRMDVLGVAILGMTTAVGGGILRDIILGLTPPAAFTDPVYAVTAIVVSIAFFIPSVRKLMNKKEKLENIIMLVMDSVGLGVFTVLGVEKAFAVQESEIFLAAFVAVVTGVGGGVLRDVFAGNTPYIFIKHFYACASIIGALVCIGLWKIAGDVPAMICGGAVTIILRLLAAHFRWSLPKAETDGV